MPSESQYSKEELESAIEELCKAAEAYGAIVELKDQKNQIFHITIPDPHSIKNAIVSNTVSVLGWFQESGASCAFRKDENGDWQAEYGQIDPQKMQALQDAVWLLKHQSLSVATTDKRFYCDEFTSPRLYYYAQQHETDLGAVNLQRYLLGGTVISPENVADTNNSNLFYDENARKKDSNLGKYYISFPVEPDLMGHLRKCAEEREKTLQNALMELLFGLEFKLKNNSLRWESFAGSKKSGQWAIELGDNNPELMVRRYHALFLATDSHKNREDGVTLEITTSIHPEDRLITLFIKPQFNKKIASFYKETATQELLENLLESAQRTLKNYRLDAERRSQNGNQSP